jgi:hypothetical protein
VSQGPTQALIYSKNRVQSNILRIATGEHSRKLAGGRARIANYCSDDFRACVARLNVYFVIDAEALLSRDKRAFFCA